MARWPARRPATARAYRADLAAFARWAERGGCTGPADVDRILLRRYLAYLGPAATPGPPSPARRRPCGPTSPGAGAGGWSSADPARRLSAPSAGGRLPEVLSATELAALCSTPTRSPAAGASGVEAGPGPARRRRARAALCRRAAGGRALRARPGRGGPRRAGRSRCGARGTRSAGCPSTTAARRPSLSGWPRAGPALAGPDSPTGGRLLEPAGQPARPARRPADPRPPLAGAHPPPRAAPQLRHPPARRRGRPAGGPGAARATPACRPPRCTPTSARNGCVRVYGGTHPRA